MKKILFIICFFCSFQINAQNKTDTYISKYNSLAVKEMKMYNIPASITLAQGILESGNGESDLAISANNHFGIKCHNNWSGDRVFHDDDEIDECFRKYPDVSQSYRDHSLFLSNSARYSFLFNLRVTDYKNWAKGLSKAGYATNPKYSKLLINLIEKYDLSKYDKVISHQKKFYFANTYGLPYLKGVSAFYITDKYLYALEVNTSFAFTEANFGLHYRFLNAISLGFDVGFIYLPNRNNTFPPYIASEIIYKHQNLLIRVGTQVPLTEIDYKFIPFIKFTYLFN